MSRTPQLSVLIAAIVACGVVGLVAPASWPLTLNQPHHVGARTPTSTGATCSWNCTLLVVYHTHAAAVARRALLRTFVKRYLPPDTDMVFFLPQKDVQPILHALEVENRTAGDLYLTRDRPQSDNSSSAIVGAGSHMELAHNLFGLRYRYIVAAVDTTVLQPVVLKHKLLGINFTNNIVYCPLKHGTQECDDSFTVYSSDVGAAVCRARMPAGTRNSAVTIKQLVQAVIKSHLVLCAARPGHVVNNHHGRVPVVAVQNVTTEEEFMNLMNYVLWNLSGWYECDMRGFEGEACAVMRYYASALAGCDMPAKASTSNQA